ncbi:M16 family metallopeptidase [Paraliomyxa miuraensis]|uniref:M16 family metallopeptidase n=1 Tax=Paraliomyxa miuraensis TaxID=376150 RepID=UPI00224F09F4|nr:pitrilysin family protein [Paraliomyxa miuraensis]MCX4247398.1 insulinase family protein [Paraliomyxa miuraensis]
MLLRLLAPCSLLACLWLPAVARADSPLTYERYSLDNGLDVVLHVDRRLPLVAVDLAYHVGWAHDGSRRGLAHLVEHLMFRGTRDVEDGEHLLLLQERGASNVNAHTDDDGTSYHALVPRDVLPLALWLEGNRMARVRLTREHVEEELQTTIDEWESRVGSELRGLSHEALWNALFPEGHPFHRADPDDIRGLTLSDAQGFVESHYGPANATLVLAGDLPADVKAEVERAFGARRGGGAPAVLSPRRSLQGEQRIARRDAMSTKPFVLIGWLTPGLFEPGDAEADVLAATLDGERLRTMADRHAPGTILELEMGQLSLSGQSMFVFAAEGTSAATPQGMLATLDAILDEVRAASLDPAAVVRTRKRLATGTLRAVQRVDQRASIMQAYVAAGHEPDWLDEDLARYAAVDVDAVAAFVREHLPRDRRVVVLSEAAEVGP